MFRYSWSGLNVDPSWVQSVSFLFHQFVEFNKLVKQDTNQGFVLHLTCSSAEDKDN